MKTKVCSKCKLEKNICEFGNYKSSKDGLLYCCKKCNNDRSKKYREENYEKVLSVQRKWRKEHPEWVKNRNKKNYIANKEQNKERVSEWHKNNPEKRKIYRENYKERKQEQRKLRRKTDEMFNIINRLRCRIFKYLKQMNITKKNKTLDIVGCSSPESHSSVIECGSRQCVPF